MPEGAECRLDAKVVINGERGPTAGGTVGNFVRLGMMGSKKPSECRDGKSRKFLTPISTSEPTPRRESILTDSLVGNLKKAWPSERFTRAIS